MAFDFSGLGSTATSTLRAALGVVGAPAWGGFAALLAVALAAYTLTAQTKAQRRTNEVTYYLHLEERWTRRLEWLLRVAAANVGMGLGYDRVMEGGPQTPYQQARGDLMVALAGFDDNELPEAHALRDIEAPQHYGPLRVDGTLEIDEEIKAARAARREATAAVERLIARS